MTYGEYLGAGSSTTKLLLHLNGNSLDSSGNGNNGSDTAISYSLANGKFGQGAYFNGTSSRSQLTSNTFLNGLSTITFNVWITFGEYNTSGLGGIMGAQSNYVGVFHFQYISSNGSDMVIYFSIGGNLPGQLACNIGNVELNKYYMISLTYDQPNKIVKIFLNGEIKQTEVYTTLPNININSVFDIGRVYDNNRYHKGLLDEVIIENVARSPEKIKKYYTWSKGRRAGL